MVSLASKEQYQDCVVHYIAVGLASLQTSTLELIVPTLHTEPGEKSPYVFSYARQSSY